MSEDIIPLNSALAIANTAHYGQVDKAGEPYILHPLRVMLRMTTREEQIVALLHDAIEDTRGRGSLEWNLERLWRFFPSETIRDALDAITRRVIEVEKIANDTDPERYPYTYYVDEPEPYFDYIARVKANPLATTVKAADICDNMREDRGYVLGLTHRERYAKALAILWGQEPCS